MQGDDEPHTVRIDPGAPGPAAANVGGAGVGGSGVDDPETLPDLLAAWASGHRDVAALLPAPGDVAGVPAVVSAAALEAGECVLVHTAAGSFAAVPEIEAFGSVYDEGHLVAWVVHRVPDWRVAVQGTVGSLADSEREVRGALISATEALASLDVARWRPEAAESIAALRSDVDPGWSVPPDLDPRRLKMLVTAARLRAIVVLATADDGGAVNLWQADQRSTALREIDRAARRAMSAATTLPPPT